MIIPDRKHLKYIAIAAAIVIVAITLMFPGYMKKTGTPEYCGSCHVMDPEFESWFYTGMHKQIKCIDCHLPNDNFIRHYAWKGMDGIKDVIYFYTGLVPEAIHSSSHAVRTIRANCERCHEEMVSRISAGAMNCWECHRKLYHNKINEF